MLWLNNLRQDLVEGFTLSGGEGYLSEAYHDVVVGTVALAVAY